MDLSYLNDSDISCLLEDLSVNENEDEKFAMLEEFKSLYAETDKEYKRYIRSEMFLSCLREVSEHPGLVPELLRDKLNRMIINTEVLESIRIKDKNGTEYNMFGLTDEDLIELQNEVLTSDEKLCIKSAVNTLLQKKCTEFRDVQSKIEKECKMLKRQEPDSSSRICKMDKNLKSLNEIAQKIELCESLTESISNLQQEYVQHEDNWKDVMNGCKEVEAKLELVNAEARVLNCDVVHAVCSENENFLKAIETLRSTLKEEVSNAECELKMLNEKLKEYETAEKDPEYKNLVKMYNKIQKKRKHMNWCLKSFNQDINV